MKHFDYAAQSDAGAAITGTLEAEDGDRAHAQLAAMGLKNIEVTLAKATKPMRAVSSDDFIFFNEQLASLAKTGICLDVGLRQLAKDTESGPLRNTLHAIAEDIDRGVPIEQALDHHSRRLPPLYARVVRAGVRSGQLPATLLNLAQHIRLVTEARRMVIDTLAYPIVVLALGTILFGGFIGYVVPQFAQIFEDFDTQLPLLTSALIDLSRMVPAITVCGFVIAGLVLLWYVLGWALPAARRQRETLLLAAPILGRLFADSIRARFIRAAALGVHGGLPLPEVIRLAGDATGSEATSQAAQQAARRVEAGETVSASCADTGILPSIFGYTVEVAGARGDLEPALSQLAQTFELRARHALLRARAFLGPILIIVAGVFLGAMILALFLPVMQLIDSVSG